MMWIINDYFFSSDFQKMSDNKSNMDYDTISTTVADVHFKCVSMVVQ